MIVLEAVCYGLFVFVAAIAALHRSVGLTAPFRLNEAHHAYLGALLVLAGAAVGGRVGLALQIVGVLLTVDDLGQHAVQTFGDEHYESPLHRFYAKYLWPRQWVRRLTEWFDEFFS